ncbi:hypothetical protein EYZ11_003003 [Aspergillus tanneri]|uniref:Uncharacterized protein n=1 Tax=Aspergillus tanneri TaxID=1220188 RepID=A0A4S3JPC4_9EURO|nr:hypothetical protein EYZ11_003003 [Aspergillus tanneri]
MVNKPGSVNAEQLRSEQDAGNRRESFSSQNSQTAKEFIETQMQLEADAREVLPYDLCDKASSPA